MPAASSAPRRRLADDLRAAIAAGEIELRYQPQVAMADDRINGVEVLARWQHGRRGELGAEALFAAARRAGLLGDLSRHIHEATLAAVARWPAALSGLGVAINVTATDLARPGFAEELLAQASAFGVDPARLTLEVTEHAPIDDLAVAARALDIVRAAGATVALDDFGSGFSSIAWLKALPVDYLKIDSDLSRDMAGLPYEQVIVRHVIAIAIEKGLGLIAEGVETERQRAALAAAGATHYQGYLCAGPLDEPALARLLEDRTCAR